jgi:hypothetical protein
MPSAVRRDCVDREDLAVEQLSGSAGGNPRRCRSPESVDPGIQSGRQWRHRPGDADFEIGMDRVNDERFHAGGYSRKLRPAVLRT